MSRHIECREKTELLLGYCAGQLQPDERVELERHLEGCPGCREFAAGQQAVLEALDAWGAPAVSPDFDRRLRERMTEVSWRDRLLARLRPAFTWKALPVAAAAGLVLVAGLVLERRPAGAPPPRDAVEQVEPLPVDQLETASQDIDILREWNGLMAPDSGDSNL